MAREQYMTGTVLLQLFLPIKGREADGITDTNVWAYLIIVIFFTLTQFLENKIYTQKTRKLRQNTQ